MRTNTREDIVRPASCGDMAVRLRFAHGTGVFIAPTQVRAQGTSVPAVADQVLTSVKGIPAAMDGAASGLAPWRHPV